jgi:uncharacterized PurR-regulated membrane protein YhhQ (DUF165 family)
MKIALAFFADVLINLSILTVSYPIWREFSYNREPPAYWWHIYAWAAVLSSAILTPLAFAIYTLTRQLSRKATAITQIVVGFLLLSVLSVVAGSSSPYAMSGWYPLDDITAKFFGELQVLTFIPLCATTMGMTSGVLLWAVLRRRTSTSVQT